MSIKNIKAYKTSTGKIFENEHEAQTDEAIFKMKEHVDNHLINQSVDATETIEWLIDNSTMIQTFLTIMDKES